MADAEYTRTKTGLIRNKHFKAGVISGVGIGIYVGSFADDSNIGYFFVAALVLGIAGLLYEAFVTDKVVKQNRKTRQEDLKKK